MNRASGVLMHISSLFGGYSIGSFGDEAKRFADFLNECGFTYWQVLPFCMIDESNSPYKSYSAFGGNPYFIDLPTLKRKGLLTDEELQSARQNTPYLCEYDRLASERIPLLKLACSRLDEQERERVKKFISENKSLCDASKFLALKEANAGKIWHEWETEKCDEEELFFWEFVQYEFFSEWSEIKAYANSLGIRIIGDVPIYVSLDSADVWANREQFQLDSRGYPKKVSGVPPDYFSEDGQKWGNPLYRWREMKKDGYSWWCERISHMLKLFDGVRIDHFRGLESYWSVDADAENAKNGKWEKGPDRDFIKKIREMAGDKLRIAEDLGDITPAVEARVKYSKFPGMRVFQFGFLGDRGSTHLPHNYEKNCIAYTGTHDNNTLLGYLWEVDERTRREIIDYVNGDQSNWSASCDAIIKTMLGSHADTVILPIQDVFVFGADTRMNTPGTVGNNWAYRITEEQLNAVDRGKYRYLNYLYGRI